MPGDVIAGFRVDRELATGSAGALYEATQPTVGRKVALRLLGPEALASPERITAFTDQQERLAAIHHPNIVPIYEVGEWAGGRFLATRFVRGDSLRDLVALGAVSPARAQALLAPIADALGAAHAQGVVHGHLGLGDVLVDENGHALLADLGLAAGGDESADRRALEALERELGSAARRRRLRRLILTSAGAALAAAAAVAIVLVTGSGDDPDPASEPPPAVAEGSQPLGSALAAGPAEALGCSPQPGPNTPPCTLAQTTLGGEPIVVQEKGVIRAWAVRGASGELTLQVIRGGDNPFARGFSATVQVDDPAPHVFPASIAVRTGDRIGVLLGLGATIGLRSPQRSSILQWGGTLSARPQKRRATPLQGELLLRADIAHGVRRESVEVLSGRQAASAEPGASLAEITVDLGAGRSAGVSLVRLGESIFIDVFDRDVRRARIAVPDLDAAGHLVGLEPICGPDRGFCLSWQNPDAPDPTLHQYKLARDGTGINLVS